jgi:hypothetical protein
MKCPKCNADCSHDSVDVGVGVIHGPYGCPDCGWSENSDYDLSVDKSPVDEKGGVIDQFGGYHPPGSPRALDYKLAKVLAEDDEALRKRFKLAKD